MSVGAVNKQTGERIPTAGMPAVDSVLSGTSTNPVQNRVVKAALDEKANTDMIAADFNAGSSYMAGDYCIYEGKLYKFKANHSGAWSAADVDEVKITGELSSLKSGLTSIGNRFAVVEGTNAAAAEQFTTLPMPSGFDAYNTVILGYTSQYSNDLWYSSNSGVYVDANGANVFVTVKDAGFASRPVKVVLYKFA